MARKLEKSEWSAFLNRFDKGLSATQAEIEVTSLNLGDKIQAEWVPLIGIVYDLRMTSWRLRWRASITWSIDHAISTWRKMHRGLRQARQLHIADWLQLSRRERRGSHRHAELP